MTKITVIGGGTMGRGITNLLVEKAYTIRLIEPDSKIREVLHGAYSEQIDSRQVTIQSALVKDMETTIVIECVPEMSDLKKRVLTEVEKNFSSDTIILSNTSGIPISELAESLQFKSRFLGLHFFTPADVNPIVEIICTQFTSQSTLDDVRVLIESIDKVPITISKDMPGFIGNRLQHAMAREAISIVAEGIASAEDVDKLVEFALAPRLVIAGPLKQRDINGLDTHLNIATYLYSSLNNSHTPSKLLKEKVEQGNLGMKTGEGFYDWKMVDQEKFMSDYKSTLLNIYQLKNEKS